MWGRKSRDITHFKKVLKATHEFALKSPKHNHDLKDCLAYRVRPLVERVQTGLRRSNDSLEEYEDLESLLGLMPLSISPANARDLETMHLKLAKKSLGNEFMSAQYIAECFLSAWFGLIKNTESMEKEVELAREGQPSELFNWIGEGCGFLNALFLNESHKLLFSHYADTLVKIRTLA